MVYLSLFNRLSLSNTAVTASTDNSSDKAKAGHCHTTTLSATPQEQASSTSATTGDNRNSTSTTSEYGELYNTLLELCISEDNQVSSTKLTKPAFPVSNPSSPTASPSSKPPRHPSSKVTYTESILPDLTPSEASVSSNSTSRSPSTSTLVSEEEQDQNTTINSIGLELELEPNVSDICNDSSHSQSDTDTGLSFRSTSPEPRNLIEEADPSSPLFQNRDNTMTNIVQKCQAGSMDDITSLLSQGVDPNTRNEEGSTGLMTASSAGHVQIITLLLDNFANANEKDVNGYTALMHVCDKLSNQTKVQTEVITTLLKYGANINEKNYDGRTALMDAAHEGNVSLVHLLLKCGADTSIKNFYGNTALDCAKNAQENGCVRLLKNPPAVDESIASYASTASMSDSLRSYGSLNLSSHGNSQNSSLRCSSLGSSSLPSAMRHSKNVEQCFGGDFVKNFFPKKRVSVTWSQETVDPPKVKELDSPYLYDVFLSHSWGRSNKNHTRVAQINNQLQLRGVRTWFDNDPHCRQASSGGEISMKDKVSQLMDNSMMVVFCMTNEYVTKVNGKQSKLTSPRKSKVDGSCHCQLEFEYACQGKPRENRLVVEMENTKKPYKGALGQHLGVSGASGSAGLLNFKSNGDLMKCVDAIMEHIVSVKTQGATQPSSKQ